MAELINKLDSLNTGREKINQSIQDAEDAKTIASDAESTAQGAVNTANEAKQQAFNTQNQLDTVIIESGTSDAETIQARTNERGKQFDILKDRLDNLDVEFEQRGVNVKWFGASGSDQSTTGSIASGSNELTVTDAIDFEVGQGILIEGAGSGGVAEVAELQITSAPITAGQVVITLNGIATNVDVDPATETTAIAVADKIRNTSFAGWTTGGTVGADTVTFVSNTVGTKQNATFNANGTGVSGSMVTTTEGQNGGNLVTSITAINGTVFTLSDSANADVTNANVEHDDTEAIMETVEVVRGSGFPFLIPKVETGFFVTDTITIDVDVDVIMDSPIIMRGNADRPIVIYGSESSVFNKKVAKLQAHHHYDWSTYGQVIDWSNENSIAIKLLNFQESNITIVDASNCTIGCQLVGINHGFSYSAINLGRLYNNKYAIDLVSGDPQNSLVLGYLTEILMSSGRISHFSGVNLDKSRYAFRSTKYNTNVFDGITFIKQSIEMQGVNLVETAEALPFLLSDMNNCDFKDFRLEKNSGTYMARLTRCYDVTFTPHTVITSGHRIEEAEVSSKGAYTNLNTEIYSEVPVITYNDLTKNAVDSPRTHSSHRILLNGIFNVHLQETFSTSVFRNFYQDDEGSVTDEGLVFNTTNIAVTNIACGFNTVEHKVIKLSKNGRARIGVLCFDELGNYLTPTETSEYVQGGFMEFSSDYFGGLYLQPDDGVTGYKEIVFGVSNEVKKIVIFLGVSNFREGTELNSFQVSAVYLDDYIRFTTLRPWFPINVKYNNFPYSNIEPNRGEHRVGDIVWNEDPSVNNIAFWICTVAGTPGTWSSIAIS